MLPIVLSVTTLALLGIGVLIIFLGLRLSSTSDEARRLSRYVASGVENQEVRPDLLTYRRVELQGSLRQRLLLPWFRRLGGVLSVMTPARSIERLKRQLAMAGSPMGLGPREFYGFQLIFIVLGFWLAFSFLRTAVVRQPVTLGPGNALAVGRAAPAQPQINFTSLAGAVLALYVGTQLPKTWLRRQVRLRKNRIRRNLPDALDMLSVCADAGLGFDQALQRVSERWNTPLGKEFVRVVQEMGMGLSRSQALRSLSDRLDVDELSSFVAVIVQSDQMGVSITETLRSQAEQMRIERRHRAQEEARKAPLKMLFPMIFLILPAMGAIVIGPILPLLMDLFATILNSAQ
jgi:tight adherence protein C